MVFNENLNTVRERIKNDIILMADFNAMTNSVVLRNLQKGREMLKAKFRVFIAKVLWIKERLIFTPVFPPNKKWKFMKENCEYPTHVRLPTYWEMAWWLDSLNKSFSLSPVLITDLVPIRCYGSKWLTFKSHTNSSTRNSLSVECKRITCCFYSFVVLFLFSFV